MKNVHVIITLGSLLLTLSALSRAARPLEDVMIGKPFPTTWTNGSSRYLPIVIWHGMGDECCNPHSIGAVVDYIQQAYPDVYVLSLNTGTRDNPTSDVMSSYFGTIDAQIDHVCDTIRSTPELQEGYIALGFSQGGQFLRGVVQRCQHRGPLAHTLVTMGSQHQGVMDVPGCWQPSFNVTPTIACTLMQKLLAFGAYQPFVQARSIQAQYFKDPVDLDVYYERSQFLADINVEKRGMDLRTKRQYRDNLLTLKGGMVLFQFANDITVVPKESSQFGFFDGTRLIPLQEDRELWDEDRLGLRELSESGRLVTADAPGFHMQFTLEWFGKNVLEKYLLVEVGSVYVN